MPGGFVLFRGPDRTYFYALGESSEMGIIARMKGPSSPPLISVVIPNYNGARFLEICLRALLNQTYRPIEILVADNGSSDESAHVVERTAPDATFLRLGRNRGFAGAANAGICVARGEWISILNNDTEAEPGWLAECMAAGERHPRAAFLAAKILQFDERNRIFGAGDCFLRAGIGYRRGQERLDCEELRSEAEVFSACGCAALYRRSALEERGGFDERFFAYLEDVELGLRLRMAGHSGWYVPKAIVFHHGGATSGGEFSALAVRLRTRNAILLILKCLPGRLIWRCALPMIFTQVFWLARVLRHGRFWSYLRGLAGVFPQMAAMLRARGPLSHIGRRPAEHLWEEILRSEAQARIAAALQPSDRPSLFLRWYFTLF